MFDSTKWRFVGSDGVHELLGPSSLRVETGPMPDPVWR